MGIMKSGITPRIPHIIHQTWKSHDIPDKWQPFQASWKKFHPDWEYRFTTDADNRAFFAEFYPQFLPIYDAYPLEINRAEAYRYFSLYHYGGVYVDMDFEALAPIDDLLRDREVVLGEEPPAHLEQYTIETRGLTRIICNAFLASVVRHPFWEHAQDLLVKNREAPTLLDKTGIFLLTRACNSYAEPSRITIVPSEYLYPIDHHKYFRGMTREQILAYVSPRTIAIHHWTGSWWREALVHSVRQRVHLAQQKK